MWFTYMIPAFEWLFVDTWKQLLMMLKDLSRSPKENYLYLHGWSKGVGCPCANWVEGLSVKKFCHSCGWFWETLTFHCHGRWGWLVPLRGTVCSCKDAFSLEHSQSCVFCPSINRWDSRTDQLVPLLSRFPRHSTSASLLSLYLVSAKWGPMEHFWRSPEWLLCIGVGRCSPYLYKSRLGPFIAELVIDIQQLFSPSSTRRV